MRSAATWGIASAVSTLLLITLLVPMGWAQTNPNPSTASARAAAPIQQAPPSQISPGQTDAAPQASQDQLPTAEPPSADDQGAMFVFKKQVEEVVLHATVVDEQGRLVTGLDKSAFSISQNGKPEPITSFRREVVPVEIGIVIDNSGSMRDKRGQVNQAVMNLIRASNNEDKVFVVNF